MFKKRVFRAIGVALLLSACSSEELESVKDTIQDALSEENSSPIATYYLEKDRYGSDETVTLDGSSSVDADKNIDSYIWTSDKDGQLGTGAKIEVTGLTIGFHKITLTVRDSEGEENSFFKSIEIYESDSTSSTITSTNSNFLKDRTLLRNSNGYVIDSLTALFWSDNSSFRGNYSSAEEYCSDLVIGSVSSWRVPTVKELWYLTDLTKSNPVADTQIWFYMKSELYWSSTDVTFYGSEDRNRAVNFSNGEESWSSRDYVENYVRCVSGEFNYTPSFERDNINDIVMDSQNMLMWQDGDITAEKYYSDVAEYCDGLIFANYTDWRVPTVKELYSIVDPYRSSEPYIYRTFLNSKNGDYIASEESENSHWSVDFETGKVDSTTYGYIRCVRDY